MALIRAQVSFERLSGLPEDRVVNTWHFSTVSTPPLRADLSRIGTMLNRFYVVLEGAFNEAPANFFSDFLAGPMRVRYYNMDVAAPRPLLAEDTFPFFPTPTPQQLPSEVALVLSYRSDRIAGVLPASERGRVYLGPFHAGAAVDGSFDSRPVPALIAAVARHATRLIGDGEVPGATWISYSPTRRSRGQAPFFGVVKSGFIDDAWDSQRRRGRDASTRTIYSDPTP
jgi:hypothetical protein